MPRCLGALFSDTRHPDTQSPDTTHGSSQSHHRFFAAAPAPGDSRRCASSPSPADCRCAIWISMPFPTPRRFRCKSTPSRRRWGRKKSSSESRFPSSKRSAACRAWRKCDRSPNSASRKSSSRSKTAPISTFARQLINERLATVELAAGIERPKMGPVATGLGEVFHYVVPRPATM